ncbi:cysteine desulfurase [Alicyclobacillus cycloheptanicus]|uniref:cysteine desulfurase n=1 Tax=Alicyclobacillus cycloheptanicus TaxID=1457 RepID=A0ABT9XK68_9BACL|nr:cysteine desulfurase family protein [Alicyclobacillus cycloheptanicus]MDQ0190520.1 cysteine desulfurase [Alicyclobacillus cycloheptanicus]WDM00721.1 cysteine desulfurase [Alicyclobacillus cycloheptanicus]
MIYLDNAATTPLHPDVFRAMAPYLQEAFGNPSSLYALGRSARKAVEAARAQVAAFAGCKTGDIVFTSGGTEADHAAMVGAWLAGRSQGRNHIVTTAIEHHAVLDTCAFLESLGAQVSYVAPQANGVVRVEDVLAHLRPDTAVVSVMAVNNELGTLQPIRELAAQVKQRDPDVMVHTDCVQAAGVMPLALGDSQVDLAALSAHKVHGPKGVGALYVREGTRWRPVVHGGNQEHKRRAGTEHVAGIVGFGAAAARLSANWAGHLAHLDKLRDTFVRGLAEIPDVQVQSPPEGAPTIVNVRFLGVRNDRLLMRLDLAGVAASAGSACTAGSLEPSHVLLACGHDREVAQQSVRFSFSELTTAEEIEDAIAIIAREISQLRQNRSDS